MSKLQNDGLESEIAPKDRENGLGEIWTKIGLTAVSALLGGVAVALFNRKILHAIQQRVDHTPPPPSNDDIY